MCRQGSRSEGNEVTPARLVTPVICYVVLTIKTLQSRKSDKTLPSAADTAQRFGECRRLKYEKTEELLSLAHYCRLKRYSFGIDG